MTPLIVDRWLNDQVQNPSGLFAPLVARWLERENEFLNVAALSALDAKPDDHVLELGCGPGFALARLAANGARQLSAVDISPAMVRRAQRRSSALRALSREGRLDVRCCATELLPFADEQFHAALAVNVAYFWRPMLTALREIRRVLRPGGRLVLAAESAERLAHVGATPGTGFATLTELELAELAAGANFDCVDIRVYPSPASYCLVLRAAAPLGGE